MSMKLKICPEPGFLRVITMGQFSLEESKRSFMEILEAVGQSKARKVLIDGRRITGKPETMERFHYGDFIARAVMEFSDRGVSRATQFAYVLEDPVLDPQRFGETIAVNRFMRMKVFDDIEDALGWLGITPAKNPDAGDRK
jgi:hypothetical protein